MPNEGPYGGQIVVSEDGQVVWQAAARSFPYGQDDVGTLEYAIRIITEDVNTFTSSNGKCRVVVHPIPGGIHNITIAKPAFLIVSGYEHPTEREGSRVIGKSYFITGSSRDEAGKHVNQMPPYDVHLSFDDEDLYGAAPIGAERLDQSRLSFCYEHWVSVRRIWTYYRQMPSVLTAVEPPKLETLRSLPAWCNRLNEDEAKMAIIWSRVYDHLLQLRVPSDTLGGIEAKLEEWSKDDMWLSIWKAVVPTLPSGIADPLEAVERAPVRRVHAEATVDPCLDPPGGRPTLLGVVAQLVKDVLGAPSIEDHFLAELPDEDGTLRLINGIYVTGERDPAGLDPQTIVVKNISGPGTFALMYHNRH